MASRSTTSRERTVGPEGARKQRASWLTVVLSIVVATSLSCSSGNDEHSRADQRGNDTGGEADDPGSDVDPLRDSLPAPVSPPMGGPEDEANKLVYLVSRDDHLYSFDPRIPGRSAYRLVGKLQCKTHGTPQSMAVDRSGWAWVFFDSGQLFKVSVRDASCSPPTSYKHPSGNRQLGMGFTAAGPGSSEERLYVLSPAFGLATVSTQSLEVTKTGKLQGGAELTGGGDARLFHFAASERQLSEIDLSSHSLKPLHKFKALQNVGAWAFARYAGKFYLFTSNGFAPSKTTEFDPKSRTESVRDEGIGFVVVGAGQSTLAPPPDASTGISGDFPPE